MTLSNCITYRLLLVAFMWEFGSAVIKVVSPEPLRQKYSNISYGLSRFGAVDYRQSIVYRIVPASQLDGCGFLDHVGESNKKVALLLQRGNCTFSKKAANGFSVVYDYIGWSCTYNSNEGSEGCTWG